MTVRMSIAKEMKRLLPAFSLCLWAVIFSGGDSLAASRVDARIDTTEMRIGDHLTLSVWVRAEKNETVRFPDLKGSLGKFELLSDLPPQTHPEDNGATLERRGYILTAFETGELSIPELPFVLMHQDGALDTLYTREMKVQVASLVTDTTASEVRPLKGLIEWPRLWHKIAVWGALALAVLGLLIYVWVCYLRSRDEKFRRDSRPLAPAKPAHLAALEELDRIKSMGLIEKGEIKQFHILVSDAIRNYLGARYGIDALEMTTWELLFTLEGKALQRETWDLNADFLNACDLVKFAKYKPQIVEINATFNRAYELVEKTRPVQIEQRPDEVSGTAEEERGPETVKTESRLAAGPGPRSGEKS